MPLIVGESRLMWKFYGNLPDNIHRAIYSRPKFPHLVVVAWGRVLEKWGEALRSKRRAR